MTSEPRILVVLPPLVLLLSAAAAVLAHRSRLAQGKNVIGVRGDSAGKVCESGSYRYSQGSCMRSGDSMFSLKRMPFSVPASAWQATYRRSMSGELKMASQSVFSVKKAWVKAYDLLGGEVTRLGLDLEPRSGGRHRGRNAPQVSPRPPGRG